jgi:hypothetical protein
MITPPRVCRKVLGLPKAVFTACGPALEAERFVHHCIDFLAD